MSGSTPTSIDSNPIALNLLNEEKISSPQNDLNHLEGLMLFNIRNGMMIPDHIMKGYDSIKTRYPNLKYQDIVAVGLQQKAIAQQKEFVAKSVDDLDGLLAPPPDHSRRDPHPVTQSTLSLSASVVSAPKVERPPNQLLQSDPLITEMHKIIKGYSESFTVIDQLKDDELFFDDVEVAGGHENYVDQVNIIYEENFIETYGKCGAQIQSQVRVAISNYVRSRLFRIKKKLNSSSSPVILSVPSSPSVDVTTNEETMAKCLVSTKTMGEIREIATNKAAMQCAQRDVAESILTCECSPNPNICGLMKDTYSKSYYEYDFKTNIWNIEPSIILENKLIESFLRNVQQYKQALLRYARESDHEASHDAIDKAKRLDKLIYKLKDSSFIKSIWEQITMIISRKIIFKPYHTDLRTMEDANFYNTFPGFKAKKVDLTDEIDPRLKRILDHIKIVWAQNNDELYNYLLSWLAHPIRTLTKTNVALVLIGGQGCGKSWVFVFLRQFVYGTKLATILPNFDPILQRFNAVLEGKMLVSIDETRNADSKKFSNDFDKFKSIITGENIPIERKGAEIYDVENYVSFPITSNHKAAKLEEDDRHYVVVECSNQYVGNKEYFDSLIKDCFNEEVGNLFYSYVRSDQITSKLIPLTMIPHTEVKDRLLEASRPRPKIFLDEIFLEGSIPIPVQYIYVDEEYSVCMQSEHMFKLFKEWCARIKIMDNTQLNTFNRDYLYKYPGVYRPNSNFRKTFDGCRKQSFYITKHHLTTIIEICLVPNDSKGNRSLNNYLQEIKEQK